MEEKLTFEQETYDRDVERNLNVGVLPLMMGFFVNVHFGTLSVRSSGLPSIIHNFTLSAL